MHLKLENHAPEHSQEQQKQEIAPEDPQEQFLFRHLGQFRKQFHKRPLWWAVRETCQGADRGLLRNSFSSEGFTIFLHPAIPEGSRIEHHA